MGLSLQSGGVFPLVIPVAILGFESLLADSTEDQGDGDSDLLAAKPWEHMRVGLTKKCLCPLLGKPNSAPERQSMSHHQNRRDSQPRLLPTTDGSMQGVATSREVAVMCTGASKEPEQLTGTQAAGTVPWSCARPRLCPAARPTQQEPR